MEQDQKNALKVAFMLFMAGVVLGACIMWAMLSVDVSLR